MRWCILAVTLGACAHERSATFSMRHSMAESLFATGDLERALAITADLHGEAPEDPKVLALRGAIYLEQGVYDVAEADLRAAIGLDDDLAWAHARLGMLFDLTRRGADAAEHHRRAVELEPRSVPFWNNLGFSRFGQGDYAGATEAYLTALRLDPSHPTVRNNLGFAYGAMRQMPEAARQFSRGGDQATAQTNLGFAYERQGNLTQAYELYQHALELEPISERAKANLRHAAKRLGRPLPIQPEEPAP
jgi:Flp pilus assembly protein TadD